MWRQHNQTSPMAICWVSCCTHFAILFGFFFFSKWKRRPYFLHKDRGKKKMKETYCRRGICISVEMMQVMLGERGVCVENMLRNQQAVTDVLTNICYFVRCECVKVICLFSFVFFTAVSYFFFLSFFLFLAHFFRSLVFHVLLQMCDQ